MKQVAKKSILSGAVEAVFAEDHSDYVKAKQIKTPKREKAVIRNPLTSKKALVVIDREGTTEKKLVRALTNAKFSQEQKDSVLTQYLFQRGLESASFLAELFQSKGQLTKETRVFKSQMRFDFEQVVNIIAQLFMDIGNGIAKEMKTYSLLTTMERLSQRFKDGADLLIKGVQKTTENRLREKGYGIYVDKNGKIFSIFDKEFDEVMARDKKQYATTRTNKQT